MINCGQRLKGNNGDIALAGRWTIAYNNNLLKINNNTKYIKQQQYQQQQQQK